jgi:hypothetical protein
MEASPSMHIPIVVTVFQSILITFKKTATEGARS